MKYISLFFMMVGTCFVLKGQQAGDLDASFNNSGFLVSPSGSRLSCVAIQKSDNKIVLGGTTGTEFMLGRLQPIGVGDSTFDSGNSPATIDGFHHFSLWLGDGTQKVMPDLKLMPDNRETFTGLISSGVQHHRSVLRRIIPGQPGEDISLAYSDVDFPGDSDRVHTFALELMVDGRMQLGGGVHYDSLNNSLGWDVCVSRVLHNGFSDPTFGNQGFGMLDLGGDEWATTMLFDGGQEIFVAGSTTPHGGHANGFLAKFNGPIPDFLWATQSYHIFGRDGADTIKSMAWHIGGRFLVAGSSAVDTFSRDEATIWRFLPNGSPDSTFGSNGVVIINRPIGERSRFEKVLVQPDGKIIGIGWKEDATNARMLVSRFDSTGFPDLTFGMLADSGTVIYTILPDIAHARNGAFQVFNNQLNLIVVGDADIPQGQGFVTRILLNYDVCAAAPVNITLSGDTLVCTYESDTLNAVATNAVDYRWDGWVWNSQILPFFSLSNDVTYHLTATSAAGCTATDSITVHVSHFEPIISSNAPICVGDSLRLTVSGAFTYQWERPDGALDANAELFFPVTNGTESGIYQVTATDGIGCTGSTGLQVQINFPPSFSVQTPPTVAYFENGDSAYISTDLQANTSLYWQLDNLDNATAPQHSGQENAAFLRIPISLIWENAPGTANLSLWATEDGCLSDTSTFPLYVWPLASMNQVMFIPEIFTPNADGVNDEWIVSNSPNPLPANLSVKIFTKQGIPILTQNQWDGRWDGANAPEGVYWYVIGNATAEVVAKGSLMLLRN